MNERENDTREHIERLEASLRDGDKDELATVAENAFLALEFRETDEMIGLDPVDPKWIAQLEELTYRALHESIDSPERAAHFAERVRQADKDEWSERALARLADFPDAAAALYQRAIWTFHGFGTKQSLEGALTLHQQAAEHGSADAGFELYCMYMQGLGTQADPARALEHCHAAAERGQTRAMSNLGTHYATGNGVAQDDTIARRWYERAALAGHGRAAAIAGIMHGLEQGEGWSFDEAERFFTLADEHDFDWRDLADASGLDPESFAAFANGDDDDDDDGDSGKPW